MSHPPLAARFQWRARLRSGLDVLTAAATFTAAVLIIWSKAVQPPVPPIAVPAPLERVTAEAIPIAGAAAQGTTTARVVILEFTDFECPFCRRFARDVGPRLEEDLVKAGRALWLVRQFPLEAIHPTAMAAAERARCADEQGAFWRFRNAVFGKDEPITTGGLQLLAEALTPPLNMAAYNECVRIGRALEIEQDIRIARSLRVRATPTLFLGTTGGDGLIHVRARFTGQQTYEQILAAVQAVERGF
jgi:protein-disulfide isomerase